jgi:hypothetical protein
MKYYGIKSDKDGLLMTHIPAARSFEKGYAWHDDKDRLFAYAENRQVWLTPYYREAEQMARRYHVPDVFPCCVIEVTLQIASHPAPSPYDD